MSKRVVVATNGKIENGKYLEYEVEGIKIYIDINLDCDGKEILIDVEKILFMKQLYQKGLSIY